MQMTTQLKVLISAVCVSIIALLRCIVVQLAPAPTSPIALGLNADMGGFTPYLATDAWNMDVSALPVNPMGARWRLKAAYDCTPLSAPVQVICTAMKKYGLILQDNGMNWALIGAPDPRWDDNAMGDLKKIPSAQMEMVQTGSITNL